MSDRIARGILHREPLLFETGSRGRSGASLPPLDVPQVEPADVLAPELLRESPPALPEASEVEVVRHFTRLSAWNHSIDHGMYPLGSCTMKYNPKVNEAAARLGGFAELHPYQREADVQGALRLMWTLERYLADISGFPRVSLQPAAGAHGELTGLMIIRAYHEAAGSSRRKVIIPDSAHGTNPASVTLNGYEPVTVKTGPKGVLEPAAVAAVAGDETAAIMITNPNTLGVYETHISEVIQVVHDAGGLVYMDGANLNAIMGKVRPASTGVDVMHFNLHKTFSTPHGGGGPGAGPVGVAERLVPFLPTPTIERDGERFHLDFERPQSIGRVRSFFGNFGVLVRAYTYISELGREGLTQATEMAVLNANYIRARLAAAYPVFYDAPTLHECVLHDKPLKKQTGVSTMDVAKRLMDFGFHPPTVYFPLIVPGALMIEPTETEPPEELDRFCDAMLAIAQEAVEDPDMVHGAPYLSGARRLDETRAARKPRLRWWPEGTDKPEG